MDIIKSDVGTLAPRTLEEAMKFAGMLAESEIIPKDFIHKPGNVLVAIQWGMELGLQPMQAMQNIAVINGRPALWGDAVIAIVRASPLCEHIKETDDGHTATCRVKRRGEEEHVRTFSVDDSKTAGLSGKQGPWTQYPKRMRQMRARAFALRDVFADILRGMPIAEEVMDIPTETDITPRAQRITEPEALPTYSDDDFKKNLPTWKKKIEDGKSSPEHIIAMVSTKAMFTEKQLETIRALAPAEAETVNTETGEVGETA